MSLRRPSLKRIAFALFVVFASLGLFVFTTVFPAAWKIREIFVDPVYEMMRMEAAVYEPVVIADAQNDLAQELGAIDVDGADAGPYLNALVPWIADGVVVAPGTLPDPATALDFEWMEQLHAFTTWSVDDADIDIDIAHNGHTVFQRPLPDGKLLTAWARRRLAVGALNGDGEGAVRDVEQLARLMTQTESLVLTLVGLKMLRDARPELYDDVAVLERLVWAQTTWGLVILGEQMPRGLDPRLAPFRCVGLDESMGVNLALRPLLREDFPQEYENATALLAEIAGSCRLTRLRSNWAAENGAGELPDGPRIACVAIGRERTGWCRLPDFTFSLPRVRSTVGNILAALAPPDSFKRYRPRSLSGGYDPHALLEKTVRDQRELLAAATAADLDVAAERERSAWIADKLRFDREKAVQRLEACGCRVTEEAQWTDVVCHAPAESNVTSPVLYCPANALPSADVRITRWTFDLASRSSAFRLEETPLPAPSELRVSQLLPAIAREDVLRDLELRGVDPALLAAARATREELLEHEAAVVIAQSARKNSVDTDIYFRALESRVNIDDVAMAMLHGNTPLVASFEIRETDDPRSVVARCEPVGDEQERRLLENMRAIERVSLDVSRDDSGLTLRFARPVPPPLE